MSNDHRARVGYLTVHPGLELKRDKARLNQVIEEARDEAKERVTDAGLELVGEPSAMVVEGTAIALDDPRWLDAYTWGPSVGIFVEVHVRNPCPGEGIGVEPDAEL